MGAIELNSTKLLSDASLESYYRLSSDGTDTQGNTNLSPSDVSFGSSYGKFGNGAYFNGTSAFLSGADIACITSAGTFTISLWTKPINLEVVRQGVIQCSKSSTNRNGITITTDGKIAGGYYNGGYTMVGSNASVCDGNWHHVVFINNGGVVKLYVDGILQSGTGYVYFHDDAGFFVGKTTNPYYSKGSIDDLAVFSKCLTEDEVMILYNNTAPAFLKLF